MSAYIYGISARFNKDKSTRNEKTAKTWGGRHFEIITLNWSLLYTKAAYVIYAKLYYILSLQNWLLLGKIGRKLIKT